jgi:hypothetical protein
MSVSLIVLVRCGNTFHVRIQPRAVPGEQENRAAVERVLEVCREAMSNSTDNFLG